MVAAARYPCASCGLARESLEAVCCNCGWSPVPIRPEHREAEPVVRRFALWHQERPRSATVQSVLKTVRILGGVLLIFWLFAFPWLAIMLAAPMASGTPKVEVVVVYTIVIITLLYPLLFGLSLLASRKVVNDKLALVLACLPVAYWVLLFGFVALASLFPAVEL